MIKELQKIGEIVKDKKLLLGIIISFVFLFSVGMTYAYFSVTTDIVGGRKRYRNFNWNNANKIYRWT